MDTSFGSGRIEEIRAGEFVTDKCFICNCPPTSKESVDPDDVDAIVSFCSDEHRALYAPTDDDRDDVEQETHFPFLVKHDPSIGRFMVAARDIEAGELIFREEPLAVGPDHGTPPSCLECMRKVDGSYFCPACNFPMCEEMCAFSEEHVARECPVFAAVDPKVVVQNFDVSDPRYWSITVLRILLLKESDPRKWDIVLRMVTHNEEHAKDAETWSMYKEQVVDFLRQKCGLADRFSEKDVFHVLGALDVNSVKIHCPGGRRNKVTKDHSQCPGHALYPLTALMSHSCMANSRTIVREDHTNECRATVFIHRGQEITKQYVNPLETTNMRRAKLKSGWYFDCTCTRCSDPMECDSFTSVTACLRCQVGNILPKNPLDPASDWFCHNCGFKTNGQAVDKLVDYFLGKISELPPESIDDWEELLTKSLKMFHNNHCVPTLIRIHLNSHYIQLASRVSAEPEDIPVEVFMRRKDLLDEIHRVIELIEPGLSRRRGISLFETATCHLQVGRLLHESDRFPADDFIQLCQAELLSLRECQKCLQHATEGTLEANVLYKCSGAIYEAEYMIRLLEQKKQRK